jgi:Transcriptional regulators
MRLVYCQLKGEPLVTRRQVTELSNHYPFEYVRASYVAERFEFTFENKKCIMQFDFVI